PGGASAHPRGGGGESAPHASAQGGARTPAAAAAATRGGTLAGMGQATSGIVRGPYRHTGPRPSTFAAPPARAGRDGGLPEGPPATLARHAFPGCGGALNPANPGDRRKPDIGAR